MNASAEQLAPETIRRIPLAALNPSPLNPRKHLGPLDELAASIKSVGVLEPLVGRVVDGEGHDCELVFGHRRLAAAKLAGVADVPVILRPYTDDQVLEVQVVENAQRADVHPLDEADGFKGMLDRGWTAQRIADRIGRSHAYVVQRLKLCGLSKACRKALDDEQISVGVAVLLAKLPTQKLQDEGLKEVGPGRFDPGIMSVADARKALEANVMLALKGAPFKLDDAELVPKAGACKACPKRTGNQAELFADASSPDLCTDPGCFREKVDALYELRVKEHKADGGEVLNQKDAKALLGHGYSPDRHKLRERYTQLDDKEYLGGRMKTVRSLFKGELPPITLAKDPESGRPVELVSAAAVRKALGAEKAERPQVDARTAAANKRERLKDLARTEATRRATAAVVEKVEAIKAWEQLGTKFLLPLARCVLEATWHDGRSSVVKRRDWDKAEVGEKLPKKKHAAMALDLSAILENHLETLRPAELAGVIVELIISRGAPAKYSGEPGDEWSGLAESLGVRYDTILANVVEEQAAAEKAKAAKAPASKPKAKKAAKKKARGKAS